MKKLFTVVMLLAMSVALHAQNDVTKFLGIPVDGTKQEVMQKLREKGFTKSPIGDDYLAGEFNGYNVLVSPVTNNNKVYRIAVLDNTLVGERDIKIRFNNLYQQFSNNSKYMPSLMNKMLDEDENISYEITVHDKRYQASFYQDGDYNKSVWFMIDKSSYGRYKIIMFYDNIYNQANGDDL